MTTDDALLIRFADSRPDDGSRAGRDQYFPCDVANFQWVVATLQAVLTVSNFQPSMREHGYDRIAIGRDDSVAGAPIYLINMWGDRSPLRPCRVDLTEPFDLETLELFADFAWSQPISPPPRPDWMGPLMKKVSYSVRTSHPLFITIEVAGRWSSGRKLASALTFEREHLGWIVDSLRARCSVPPRTLPCSRLKAGHDRLAIYDYGHERSPFICISNNRWLPSVDAGLQLAMIELRSVERLTNELARLAR